MKYLFFLKNCRADNNKRNMQYIMGSYEGWSKENNIGFCQTFEIIQKRSCQKEKDLLISISPSYEMASFFRRRIAGLFRLGMLYVLYAKMKG